jgi:ubiquinone/menaquinone biosynthesis C-methylase UbiE
MLDSKDGDVILDIGCGSGVQIRALDISPANLLIVIDVNRNELLFAKNKKSPNVSSPWRMHSNSRCGKRPSTK